MASIALFHSVLGRPAGDHRRRRPAAGRRPHVLVVDQYDGRVFDDYEEAGAHVDRIGFPALMQAAVDAVADLPDGFVVAGFSNGAGMAEYVATQRACRGAVLFAGALPLAVLGVEAWPAGVPVQVHHTEGDPRHAPEWLDAFVADVRRAGAPSRSSGTRAAATCSPTRACPPSTTRAATEAVVAARAAVRRGALTRRRARGAIAPRALRCGAVSACGVPGAAR
jgi:dienelactone hydrolase